MTDGGSPLGELLATAGQVNNVRRNRADCIRCADDGKRGTVAIYEQAEVARCFRCGWYIYRRQLLRDLGQTIPAETPEQREARRLKKLFEQWRNDRYRGLAGEFCELGRKATIAKSALAYFPMWEMAWDHLAHFYHNEARLSAALDALVFEPGSRWLEEPVTREELSRQWRAHAAA